MVKSDCYAVKKFVYGDERILTPTEIFGGGKDFFVSKSDFSDFFDDFKAEQKGASIFISYLPKKDESFYGLGLQTKGFRLNGKRRALKVNADASGETGDSHAPTAFFVSSANYGLMVDTLAKVTFYFGGISAKASKNLSKEKKNISDNTEDLYNNSGGGRVIIEINSSSVSLFLFNGESIKKVVSDFNLFWGGGAMPSKWGLGVMYRAYTKSTEKDIEALTERLNEDNMHISVLGLEPGWQSRSYSCSYVPSESNFPNFYSLVEKLRGQSYHVNLWEHAFVHQESPLYAELYDKSGDFEVWNGLTPDFVLSETAQKFGDYHDEKFLSRGVDGFKLDECDDSDYTGGWSFPPFAQFPSGLNGAEMHTVYGLAYARVFDRIFKKSNKRYFSLVRSSGLGASPYPFALYSDLYDYGDFTTALSNAAFSGLLWAPEVRQCESASELVSRIMLAVFSPFCAVNAWMCPNEPWKQYQIELNKANVLCDEKEELTKKCRELFALRDALSLYLYSAYYRYHTEGIPPVRPLVMDFLPDDEVRNIYDEFLFGDDFLIAPLKSGESERYVYLPSGLWYAFFSEEKFLGGKWYKVDNFGVFVREGAVIPFENEDSSVDLTCYGNNLRPIYLFEDDGETYNYEKGDYNIITVCADEKTEAFSVTREGKGKKKYNFGKIKFVR